MNENEIYSIYNKKKIKTIKDDQAKGILNIHGDLDVDVIAKFFLGMKQNNN
jgi:hypothetical protein